MGLIRISRPWTQQPQGPVGVDQANPLTKGIKFLYNASSNSDVAGLGLPNLSKTGVRGPKSGGLAYLGDGSSYLSWNAPVSLFNTSEMTVVNVFIINAAYGSVVGFAQGYRWSTPAIAAKIYSYDGYSYWLYLDNTYVADISWPSGSVSPATIVGCVTSQSGVANGTKLYINGRVGATTGTYTFPTLTTLTVGLGADLGTGGVIPSGTAVLMSAMWNRVLSPSEIASISANPWQLFAPQVTNLWTPEAAAPTGWLGAWGSRPARNIGTGVK